MKKTFLLKTMLLLCALVVGGNAWADLKSVTYVWDSTNKVFTLGSATGDNVDNVTISTTTTGTSQSSCGPSTSQKSAVQLMSPDKNNNPRGTFSFTLTNFPYVVTGISFNYYTTSGNKSGSMSATVGGVAFASYTADISSNSGWSDRSLNVSGNSNGNETVVVSANYTTNSVYVHSITISYNTSGKPKIATIGDLANKTLQAGTNGTFSPTITGATGITSNDYTVAWTEVNNSQISLHSDGSYIVNGAGNVDVTVTVTPVEGKAANYDSNSRSYSLTIQDNRSSAALSWSTLHVYVAQNSSEYILPTLNNPNSINTSLITYTSDNTSVASIGTNNTIEVHTNTLGTAKITASFAGDASYKPSNISYNIEVIDPTVKGSIFNPYSVAEVRAVSTSNTISDVYIRGYIVGYVNSTYDFTNDVSKFSDSNWAIADSKTETDKANTAPVQIASANQDNYSLAKHPVLVGAKVLIKGNITKYFNVSGIKNLDEITIESVPAKITSAEYATFACPCALDFSTTGISVYIAADNTTSVTLNEVTTGKVPANSPVVLYKANANGTAIDVPATTSAPAISGTNDLRVSDGTTTLTNAYVLAMNPTIGFYPWSGTTLSAGKIYLQGSASYTRDFIGIGDASGISNVKVNTNLDGNYYDLQGRTVAQPTKGLYIVNGKKVIIK